MKQPFFSVIIPTLNEEKYISRLLAALSRQQFRDFEVIIVDGNSNDKTLDVASKFAAEITLNLMHANKRNLSYQRNQGAFKARGEYLVFLDADTMPPADYLKLIKSTINIKHVTLLTTYLKGDDQRWFYKYLMRGVNMTIQIFKFIDKQFACGANLIIRRDKFLAVRGFREDLTMSEDHDLTLRLRAMGCRLTIIKQTQLELSMRRIRSEGLTSIVFKYMVAIVHMLLLGPMTKKIYNYPMGGHVHDSD